MNNKEPTVLKLSSGEVLIGNISTEDPGPGMLLLNNVCRLVEFHAQSGNAKDGQAELVMVPYMPFTKAVQKTLVGISQVVTMSEPVDELRKNHADHFSKKPAKPSDVTTKKKTDNLLLPGSPLVRT